METELKISRVALDRIVAETNAQLRQEVCGLLLGSAGRIEIVVPCSNVATDPAVRFEIDPAALISAHRTARTGGPAVIGCYHSHPGGRAEPSPRDAADAAPDETVWLIAAGERVTAWRAIRNGSVHGRFVPLRLRPVGPFAK